VVLAASKLGGCGRPGGAETGPFGAGGGSVRVGSRRLARAPGSREGAPRSEPREVSVVGKPGAGRWDSGGVFSEVVGGC
jgi:hypothetical protein